MSNLVLVSDTAWVENEVKAALSVGGWEVETITDPHQAVPTVDEHAPEAVLVDMQIGSKGGMAVVRAIRQSASNRPRLILLLDRSADAFLAGRAGADAYVLKPIVASQLRMALTGTPAEEEE